MTNPVEVGPDQPVVARRPSALPVVATLFLAIAGGLAVGGSFGLLVKESEQAGNQTLTLSYTSWRLVQGGNYPTKIYFHAPHFGIPLVATGVLVVVGGLLLMTGRFRIAAPLAAAAAGMLVGTVWTMAMVVSADLDAVDRTAGFQLSWTSGIGFWLVSAAGVAAAIGGVLALLTIPPVPAPLTPSPRPREPKRVEPD
ncbi:MAG TPA: hypothetical protein VF892_19470 [Pseudonocardiaceae bacterium]